MSLKWEIDWIQIPPRYFDVCLPVTLDWAPLGTEVAILPHHTMSSGNPTTGHRGLGLVASFIVTPTPQLQLIKSPDITKMSVNIYGCQPTWLSQSHKGHASWRRKLILFKPWSHLWCLYHPCQQHSPLGECMSAAALPCHKGSCPHHWVGAHLLLPLQLWLCKPRLSPAPSEGLCFRLAGSGRGVIKNCKCFKGAVTFRTGMVDRSMFPSFIYLVGIVRNFFFPVSGNRLQSKFLILLVGDFLSFIKQNKAKWTKKNQNSAWKWVRKYTDWRVVFFFLVKEGSWRSLHISTFSLRTIASLDGDKAQNWIKVNSRTVLKI